MAYLEWPPEPPRLCTQTWEASDQAGSARDLYVESTYGAICLQNPKNFDPNPAIFRQGGMKHQLCSTFCPILMNKN
jgi:hypothetical protein